MHGNLPLIVKIRSHRSLNNADCQNRLRSTLACPLLCDQPLRVAFPSDEFSGISCHTEKESGHITRKLAIFNKVNEEKCVVIAVFLVTAIVVLLSLVRCLLAVFDKEQHRGWWITNIVVLLAGMGYFLVLSLIGSYVDEQGILHEPFALVPIGYLLSIIGILGTLLRVTLDAWRAHTLKQKNQ